MQRKIKLYRPVNDPTTSNVKLKETFSSSQFQVIDVCYSLRYYCY